MTPRPPIPVATLLLVAINIVAAFGVALDPDLPFDLGFRIEDATPWTALTSLFLHQNLLHLFSNMAFLAAVGGTVEQLSGTARFVTVYFVSGLVGVAAHMVLGTPGTPLIGASGAVAGCAAYYCFRYLPLQVPIAPKIGCTVAGVTIAWLALQIAGAFIHIGQERVPVSFWAHIGGFIAGVVLTFTFRAPDLAQVRARQTSLKEAEERSPNARVTVAKKILEEHPNDVAALRELADAHRTMGDPEHEEEAILKLIEVLPESAQAGELRRLCELNRAGSIPALRRTLLAERFKVAEPETAAALLLSVIAEPESEAHHPDALFALASLIMQDQPERAMDLLRELKSKFPLHPAMDLARARGWVS